MKTLKFLTSLFMCAGLLWGMDNGEPEPEPMDRPCPVISSESISVSLIEPSPYTRNGRYCQVASIRGSFATIELDVVVSNVDYKKMDPRILKREDWPQVDLDQDLRYSVWVNNPSLSNVDKYFRVAFKLKDSTFKQLIDMTLDIVHHGNHTLTSLNEYREINGRWVNQPTNLMTDFINQFKTNYPNANDIEYWNL